MRSIFAFSLLAGMAAMASPALAEPRGQQPSALAAFAGAKDSAADALAIALEAGGAKHSDARAAALRAAAAWESAVALWKSSASAIAADGDPFCSGTGPLPGGSSATFRAGWRLSLPPERAQALNGGMLGKNAAASEPMMLSAAVQDGKTKAVVRASVEIPVAAYHGAVTEAGEPKPAAGEKVSCVPGGPAAETRNESPPQAAPTAGEARMAAAESAAARMRLAWANGATADPADYRAAVGVIMPGCGAKSPAFPIETAPGCSSQQFFSVGGRPEAARIKAGQSVPQIVMAAAAIRGVRDPRALAKLGEVAVALIEAPVGQRSHASISDDGGAGVLSRWRIEGEASPANLSRVTDPNQPSWGWRTFTVTVTDAESEAAAAGPTPPFARSVKTQKLTIYGGVWIANGQWEASFGGGPDRMTFESRGSIPPLWAMAWSPVAAPLVDPGEAKDGQGNLMRTAGLSLAAGAAAHVGAETLGWHHSSIPKLVGAAAIGATAAFMMSDHQKKGLDWAASADPYNEGMFAPPIGGPALALAEEEIRSGKPSVIMPDPDEIKAADNFEEAFRKLRRLQEAGGQAAADSGPKGGEARGLLAEAAGVRRLAQAKCSAAATYESAGLAEKAAASKADCAADRAKAKALEDEAEASGEAAAKFSLDVATFGEDLKKAYADVDMKRAAVEAQNCKAFWRILKWMARTNRNLATSLANGAVFTGFGAVKDIKDPAKWAAWWADESEFQMYKARGRAAALALIAPEDRLLDGMAKMIATSTGTALAYEAWRRHGVTGRGAAVAALDNGQAEPLQAYAGIMAGCQSRQRAIEGIAATLQGKAGPSAQAMDAKRNQEAGRAAMKVVLVDGSRDRLTVDQKVAEMDAGDPAQKAADEAKEALKAFEKGGIEKSECERARASLWRWAGPRMRMADPDLTGAQMVAAAKEEIRENTPPGLEATPARRLLAMAAASRNAAEAETKANAMAAEAENLRRSADAEALAALEKMEPTPERLAKIAELRRAASMAAAAGPTGLGGRQATTGERAAAVENLSFSAGDGEGDGSLADVLGSFAGGNGPATQGFIPPAAGGAALSAFTKQIFQ